MGTKTIKTNITLHVPGKAHKPFKFDANGATLEGKYDVVRHPPGTEVELDGDEADEILARFGGEEVKGDDVVKGTPAPTPKSPSVAK